MLQLLRHPQRRRGIYALSITLLTLFSATIVWAQAKKHEGQQQQAKPDAAAIAAIDTRNFLPPLNTSLLADGGIVYTRPERMPTLNPNLGTWLGSNVHYSQDAIAAATQGKTVVQFVVDAAGHAGAPTLKETSGHAVLDEAVMNAVRVMPQWTPGTYHGQAVPVLVTMPVMFKVNEKGQGLAFWEGC